MAENLDTLKCGGWGVFIALTTKMAVGEGFGCRAHRTVRCATGHSPVHQPRHPTVRVRPLELLTTGPPDSPVVHHRCCSLSGAPFDACSDFCAQARTIAFHCSFADDRWRCIAVTPLAHRTVR
jgi:hypothetical protein